MNDTTQVSSSGITFVGLLTIVFITLKLTNYISWSWVWVLSPLWMSAVLSVVTLLFLAAVGVVIWLITCRYDK